MPLSLVKNLPPPPSNKIGFPWTGTSTPQYVLQNLPKITIITPSFNQGHYIEETIRSVLLQNYPNLEYIIIDGGSTDQTISIIKKYEKWITYWVSEPDNGQSDAINKGLAAASGEIFNWLNSDDVLAPNALLEIGYTFANQPNKDVLIGYIQFILHNRLHIKPQRLGLFKEIEATMNFGSMTQPSLFYRLSIVKKLGGVDLRLFYVMDLDLWYRYLLTFGAESIALTDKTLAYFRIHEKAKSHSVNQSYGEKLTVLLTMLQALGFSKHQITDLIKPTQPFLPFDKKWDFNTPFINQKRFIAYLIEQILINPYFDFSAYTSFRFWLISFKFQWKGRRKCFFTLPFRVIYRKVRKYIIPSFYHKNLI